jgi:hypothetical protein
MSFRTEKNEPMYRCTLALFYSNSKERKKDTEKITSNLSLGIFSLTLHYAIPYSLHVKNKVYSIRLS